MKQNLVRHSDINDHLKALRKELQHVDDTTFGVISNIVHIRRGVDINTQVMAFHNTLKLQYRSVFSQLDTRWLVSIADTFADTMEFGGDAEAMLISQHINMIKLAQTYIDYCGEFKKPEKFEHYELWDGVINYKLDGGDMPSNMNNRIKKVIKNPVLKALYEEVRLRQYKSGNFMDKLGVI